MKLTTHRTIKKPRIELIPMIDTMFFLLVFYILSSLALAHQEAIPVDLPKAATGQDLKQMEFIVTITKDNQYFINKTPITEETVGSALKQDIVSALGATGISRATVIVNADLSVIHRRVVEVMDECRMIGITHFAVATTPRAEPTGISP